MIEWLDSIGIRDPFWGTLGWVAVLGAFWGYFYVIYLMFYVNAPGWRDKEWRWHRD